MVLIVRSVSFDLILWSSLEVNKRLVCFFHQCLLPRAIVNPSVWTSSFSFDGPVCQEYILQRYVFCQDAGHVFEYSVHVLIFCISCIHAVLPSFAEVLLEMSLLFTLFISDQSVCQKSACALHVGKSEYMGQPEFVFVWVIKCCTVYCKY